MSELNEHKTKVKTSDEIRYQNELMKRRFFDYQRDSVGYAENSIDTYENALLRWQEFTGDEDFRLFNKTRAKQFKDWLASRPGVTEETLSISYQYHTLRKLKGFFKWLAMQDVYKQSIKLIDIDFLNLGKKESRQAVQTGRRKFPTIEQVKTMIEFIEPITEVDRRDRALICFALITGARISAIVSLPVRAFDRDDCVVDQNPALGVNTKYAKRITTALFPLKYDKPREYFLEWYDYIVNEKEFGPNDPIFPATKLEQGVENISYYSSGDVSHEFWAKSGAARKIFEKRFKAAGVPYFHPHTFRHLVVRELMKIPLTEEQKKAVSQNLGHEHVSTTFGSYGYGKVKEERQIELLSGIDFDAVASSKAMLGEEDLERIAAILTKSMKNNNDQ
jgi:integrase/recombinase XerD